MKRLLVSLVTLCLLLGGAGIAASTTAQASSGSEPIRFGMDTDSIRHQTNADVKPDYGVMWIGPWTLSSGWGGPSDRMKDMRSQGITPVIHFYYWGDDISPDCVKNGCWSSLHNTWKDQDGWQRLADELVTNLHRHMGGETVIIIMETEFNKGEMNTYKPFDYQLRDMTNNLKWRYDGAEMVLGLGNWNRHNWSTWTASAAASDYIGVQAMAGSTRDSLAVYNKLYSETLEGAKAGKSLFGKDIFITDIALSSYPEPEYLKHQRDNLKKFFDNLDALRDEGVKAMLYRTWVDQSTKNLANYYGQAERHWGFAYSGSGSWKPAASVWVDGVKAERASGGASSGTGSGSESVSGTYSASFTVRSSVNEWWIDVDVKSSPSPAQVHVRIDAGSWQRLDATSWGTWAKSIHAPAGSTVEFRATAPDGDRAYSKAYNWLQASSGSSESSSYSAKFTPSSSVNQWWIDVKVGASPNPDRVHVRIDGGSWQRLDATSWGTWAKSIHAPSGSTVEFRATAPDGVRAYSEAFTWLQGSSGSSGDSSSSGSSSYSAKFTPSSSVNQWWIDVKVGASPNPERVHARVDGGSWQRLDATSWGSWAKSIHAPAGSTVEFRATAPDGSLATSETFTWLGFEARFSPSSSNSNWWVEVNVRSDENIRRVDACIKDSCTRLSETDWGSWARSFNVPKGSQVQFVATNDSGQKATSKTYTW